MLKRTGEPIKMLPNKDKQTAEYHGDDGKTLEEVTLNHTKQCLTNKVEFDDDYGDCNCGAVNQKPKQQLVSGAPVPNDRSHAELKYNGQQKDYVVLSPGERAKGFVRPLRRSYIHTFCGGETRMSQEIAETYARDPNFYNGTFCCGCGKHFPLDQFVWKDAPNERVGS